MLPLSYSVVEQSMLRTFLMQEVVRRLLLGYSVMPQSILGILLVQEFVRTLLLGRCVVRRLMKRTCVSMNY